MADTKYLVQRRQGWYVAVEVPPSRRSVYGRRIVRSLKTRDLATARALRWKAVAEIKALIASSAEVTDAMGAVEQGLAWREALSLARSAPETHGSGEQDGEGFVRDLMLDEVERLRHGGKAAQAQTVYGIAMGQAVPLVSFIEQWLREGGRSGTFEERTKKDHQRAVKGLCDWLRTERLPETAQAVERAVAGRYVSSLIEQGLAGKTIGKTISSLSTYWDWLRRRGHVSEDQRCPWAGQAPPKGRNTGREEERPFTTDEVRTLIANAPDDTMREFMLVAALSGMRREEIGRLRVDDCAGHIFNIQKGKTEAAKRRVPIHTALQELVERRCKGALGDAYLFAELTSNRPERTDAIGKVFGRYRESLGINDRPEGQRRSLVNFHSFRRWFITQAVNAGQEPHMVSLVVGHTEGRKGMTLGRYWGGADDAKLREIVEAVEL